jgi:hypothetical protein
MVFMEFIKHTFLFLAEVVLYLLLEHERSEQ